jgi:hypothetical protein
MASAEEIMRACAWLEDIFGRGSTGKGPLVASDDMRWFAVRPKKPTTKTATWDEREQLLQVMQQMGVAVRFTAPSESPRVHVSRTEPHHRIEAMRARWRAASRREKRVFEKTGELPATIPPTPRSRGMEQGRIFIDADALAQEWRVVDHLGEGYGLTCWQAVEGHQQSSLDCVLRDQGEVDGPSEWVVESHEDIHDTSPETRRLKNFCATHAYADPRFPEHPDKDMTSTEIKRPTRDQWQQMLAARNAIKNKGNLGHG